MKDAWRGAFWSGLLFPGLGQIVLRRYIRGIILMLTTLAIMGVIVAEAVRQALLVLENLDPQLLNDTIDLDVIVEEARRASAAAGGDLLGVMTWLLLACWMAGIVDAYRIGRKRDLQAGISAKRPEVAEDSEK